MISISIIEQQPGAIHECMYEQIFNELKNILHRDYPNSNKENYTTTLTRNSQNQKVFIVEDKNEER